MFRKKKIKIYCAVYAIFITIFTFNVSALDLKSDLSYNFSNQTQTEYYNSNTISSYNITGDMPGYVQDLLNTAPQTVYNSEYGTNIILPDCDFDIYPAGNKPYYAPETPYKSSSTTAQSNGNSIGTSIIQNNSTNNSSAENSSSNGAVDYPDVSSQAIEYSSFSYGDTQTNSYNLTPVSQVLNSDGSIGKLVIPKIGLNITAYDGDISAAMLKGAAHIASTSFWNGNIGLVGHNRGVKNNFGRLGELTAGDIIQYTTKLGTRQYKVVSVETISETDWTKLQYTSDNRINLVTCIANTPGVRLIVTGIQVV
ncbi:MAG: class D sortase [Oscillospiraceae bacterium]|nr:class D sortase [Oscillospiraceae bacterium]